MPGWHEKLQPHVENEEVVELGLIQEQHPDRCKLFMQWKQMDFPVMVDSLNLLGVKVVPITLFIDEHGIIQKVRPKQDELGKFLAANYPAPMREVPEVERPMGLKKLKELRVEMIKRNVDLESVQWELWADQMFLFGARRSILIATWYERRLVTDSDNGGLHFRLGVAYRARHDSEDRQDEDFANAMKHWERSLEIDPNHYIRRRRIQQYGPRLDKPYSFYDWVNTARDEITGRGDVPVELVTEPGGAEFAHPDKTFEADESATNPDPEAKINLDKAGLIEIQSVPVPGTIKAGQASRVHLTFQVNDELKAHWNNEAGDSLVWINAPEGWSVEKKLWTIDNAKGATSAEDRKIEFEVRAPANAKPGDYTLKAFALYYVCEDVDGVCQYLRQDFEVQVAVE